MKKIEEYITIYLNEPNIANNIILGILEKIFVLEIFPYIGQTYYNDQNRFLIYKNYLIFYEIQENKELVIIKRIMHTKIVL